MKKLYSSLLLTLTFALSSVAQIVTTNPQFPTESDKVTIVFDAAQGSAGLKDYIGKVYAHTGVITDKSTGGSDWKYAPAWLDNNPKYELTSLGSNKWQLEISPDVRQYYGVPAGEKIKQLAFVFRSSDGKKEGKDTGGKDIFVDLYEAGLTVRIDEPATTATLEQGKSLSIKATSSANAKLTLFVGSQQIAQKTNVKEITATHPFAQAGTYEIKVEADDGSGKVTDTRKVNVLGATQEAKLPAGVRPGINYTGNTEATLVLQAPNKKTVYLVGDFNDWEFDTKYQLKRDGEYFWTTLTGLTAGQEYAFQYVVDGSIYIADPYTEKVLDPWNDEYIPETVYPNLKPYPAGKAEGIVSVLQTGQQTYNWKVKNFAAPDKHHLIVYEMLIRDFTKEHSYKAAIAKLDYLQELGVNAIELMPVNEFEGNSSWGYNPSFYFAPDKYYGTKNDLKAFVDECHSRGMAVILDLVLNHSFGQSPFYLLYRDTDGNPSADNPWYNVKSPIPNPDLNWGYDFNHESPYTEALVDSVASFWMNEYKVDGFRYDFTKGFSNTTPPDLWASTYDASRIAILKRMANEVWKRNPGAYVIFEHLTEQREEKELGQDGIILWRNMNNAYCQSAMGWSAESAFSGVYAGTSMPAGSLLGYMESHDEERTSYKAKTWGDGTIKTSLTDRMKQAQVNAAFFFTVPGPKMIWQFGELGYDISIDENGRTGEKPVLWEYYEDDNRKALYDTYSKLIDLRLSYPELFASNATFSWKVGTSNWANGRFITAKAGEKAVVVAGNFTAAAGNYSVEFPNTGKWYDYMSGTTINVTAAAQTISVPAHEFRLYLNFEPTLTSIEDMFVDGRTSKAFYNRLSDCIEIPGDDVVIVEVYSLNGIIVQKQENVSSVGLSVLPSGYYTARIYYQNGETEVCKIIK